MKRLTIALACMTVVVAACGEPDQTGGTGTAPTTTTAPGDDTATVMALALRELLTEQSTFGQGHRFDAVLIQTSTDPAAGFTTPEATSRPLTDGERVSIEAAITDLSADVRWVDDPDEWRNDDLMPEIPGSAIIGVGEPTFDDDGALVPVSLWCGGLCGTWFTWRLEITDGQWAVTGIEGPVAVS